MIMPLTYAYNHRMYDPNYEYIFFKSRFPSDMQNEQTYLEFEAQVRMFHHVLESYKHDIDLMWTVLAYLLENRPNGSLNLSCYEQDCKYDKEYIKLGQIIKKILQSKRC